MCGKGRLPLVSLLYAYVIVPPSQTHLCKYSLTPHVMETLDSAELFIEDQAQLDYLWDFETRGTNLDFSSMLSSPGPDTD